MQREELEKRLKALRNALRDAGGDAWIQPMEDRFQSEYTPDCAQRLPWLTGFTGSAGTVIVTADEVLLFVDGRYTLQAAQEVPEDIITIHNVAKYSAKDAILAMEEGATLLFDAHIHTHAQVKGWQASAANLTPHTNLIDTIWADQPAPPAGAIKQMPDDVAGETRTAKVKRLAEKMHKEADACFIALPDAVNWLLNIRGDDVPYNPLLLSYALVTREEAVKIFTYAAQVEPLKALLPEVEVFALEALDNVLAAQSGKIQIDASQASYAVAQAIGEGRMIEASDPVTHMKAVKNAAEIAGMQKAHVKDGKALSQFIAWFNEADESVSIDEIGAAEKLASFRQQGSDYLQPSFTTISGAAGNGAIVHYRVTPESNRAIAWGDMYLVDSGGQYPFGTTDVTRTLVRGAPTDEMKLRYTQVLKGHIALASAVFPEGTTGSELDVLARQYLWADGVDYAHGTGHGVGHYLCVHEGPQGISRRSKTVALEEGMVLSNEPGYYKTDAFGIRLENLVHVVKKGELEDGRTLLGFENLTLAPFEEKLVLWEMMTQQEKAWWDDYHALVAQKTT